MCSNKMRKQTRKEESKDSENKKSKTGKRQKEFPRVCRQVILEKRVGNTDIEIERTLSLAISD